MPQRKRSATLDAAQKVLKGSRDKKKIRMAREFFIRGASEIAKQGKAEFQVLADALNWIAIGEIPPGLQAKKKRGNPGKWDEERLKKKKLKRNEWWHESIAALMEICARAGISRTKAVKAISDKCFVSERGIYKAIKDHKFSEETDLPFLMHFVGQKIERMLSSNRFNTDSDTAKIVNQLRAFIKTNIQ